MLRSVRRRFGLICHLGASGVFDVSYMYGKGATFAVRGKRLAVLRSLSSYYASIFKRKTHILMRATRDGSVFYRENKGVRS